MTRFTEVPKVVEEVLENGLTSTSRRQFLKTSGALVVTFSASADGVEIVGTANCFD